MKGVTFVVGFAETFYILSIFTKISKLCWFWQNYI